MNGGSLFSGCGGLDLGLARVLGVEWRWHAESDKDCRRVLAERWPGVPCYPDVRELDGGTGRVDLLAGGFPCPDFSVAGKGLGFEGPRAKLWFEFARAVRLLRPRYVIVENVCGLVTSGGIGVVLADLAQAGYVGEWVCLRASDVGAPHRRERVFVLATDADGRRREQRDEKLGRVPVVSERGTQAPTDAEDDGREWSGGTRRRGAGPADGGQAPTDWGVYEPAIRRWEHTLGRPAPRPTDARGRLEPEFVSWMMGFPQGWTDVGVSRTARLKMLGNAVQVQVAEQVGAGVASVRHGRDE